MGIAGLASRLEPYAARFTAADLRGYHAIIDGPSLAYHASKLALAADGYQSRIPSYADINRQALRWLKTLEVLNIKVSAILFDGVLPATKIDERLDRLNKSNQRVRRLRIQYPKDTCPIPNTLDSVSYSFLAPALKEALSYTEYASVTRLVPGEADDWCALCANDTPRSIIFSSDSDLLLYHYQTESRIMFFNHVELWPEPKFKGYSTLTSQSLGLSSLLPLAYCLMLDSCQMFHALVEKAKAIDTESSDYTNFSMRYGRPEASKPNSGTQELPIMPQYLDVRVSEFIDQVQNDISTPVVYLPLLVEDQNAASAWNTGNDVRLLAYSLFTAGKRPPFSFLGICEKHRQTAQDYRRKAQAVSVHDLTLYKPGELVAAAADMAGNISTWMKWTTQKQVPRDLVWPLIALHLVLHELTTVPKISLLTRVLSGDFNETWGFIHLTARYHAALYSLRILKQCIAYWLSTHPDTSAEMRHHMDTLNGHLVDMPSIAELFLVPGQAKKNDDNEQILKELLEEMYTSAQIEVPSEKVSNKKMKKQKREAERKESVKMPAGGQESFNVFDILNRV